MKLVQVVKDVKVKTLFNVLSGDCHATSELDAGKIPLISCGDFSNGLVGYFDIPDKWIRSHAITVAYNGSWPLTTKFHPYPFGAKDDVAVLVPRSPMKDSVMLYAAALLNRMIWRYSYGRKCFKEKLQDVSLLMPVRVSDREEVIDETVPDEMFARAFARVSRETSGSVNQLFQRDAKSRNELALTALPLTNPFAP